MPTLEFKGKSIVYAHHLSVPFRALVIDPKKSMPAKGKTASLGDNLIIHGDNLLALKALLPAYAGKIDCICIDPPYNTGNEGWCYNDNVRSPLLREWIKKSANPVDKEDLERHDKWLCMMWPRLTLLWELLSDEGALFVTCDDNEGARLGAILDEICGEKCFVSCIVWQKVFAKKNKAQISGSHDYIYVYSKRGITWERNLLERSERQTSAFSNPDNDERGDWQSVSFSVQTEDASKREKYRYKIKLPSGRVVPPPPGRHWNGLESRYNDLKSDNRFWYGEDGDNLPRQKVFLTEVQGGIVPDTWWRHEDCGNNQEAKKELNDIFGKGDVFPNPKPTRLIERILHIATKPDSIVLDSFAGSGTTAHAVLALNNRDGGDRKFILVESEDYANEITAERVRKVIKGYRFEGVKREDLLREKLTWAKLKNNAALVERAEGFDLIEAARFDRVTKTVKNGELIVSGEKQVAERVAGLAGSFTFATLGEEISLESLLSDGLPSYETLAKYIFYTATGRTLEKLEATSSQSAIGETDRYVVYLHYKPDRKWLQGNDAALTEPLLERLVAGHTKKKRILVFAAAKFMGQRELSKVGVEFCQLPYAIHRLLGD